MSKFAIAVHGGAGTILKSSMIPELEEGYRGALEEALEAGYKVLAEGGSAMNAVEAAVIKIEDNTHFNAGRGSVFNHDGKHEMDASIMDGDTLLAGAVAGVSNIKNPVVLARNIMEQSEHVLLCGRGAEEFARKLNLEFQPDEYFFTQHRYNQLKTIRESNQSMLDHIDTIPEDKKFGTGGAVALDMNGNLAAATSTGGMTNKRYGRIGDSPIIGAGTYANNKTCAISCTGHGEYFIRSIVAYDISCLMEYKGYNLKEACEFVVQQKLVERSGEGGLIALDVSGNFQLIFNTEGMYRGFRNSEGLKIIGIYKE